MDVLLINPPSPSFIKRKREENKSIIPPLGLCYISAMLKKEGFKVGIIDMEVEEICLDNIKSLIRKEKPGIVGITSMVISYKNALKIAKELKESFPKIKIVMGGPQASFLIKETFEEAEIDAICIFEGEETILELASFWLTGKPDIRYIKGIAYTKKGNIFINPKRPFIENLDNLPFLDRDLKNRYSSLPVITGRGCSYKCFFCSAPGFWGKARFRSPENIIKEILELIKKNKNGNILFVDDTFTLDLERLQRICDLIYQTHLNISWGCQGHLNKINMDIISKMCYSGCKGISFGVESGDTEVLRRIKKVIDLPSAKEIILNCLDMGLKIACSFIIGTPFDTKESMRKTFEFVTHLVKSAEGKKGSLKIAFSYFTPLPGTEAYNYYVHSGLKFLTFDWNFYNFLTPVVESNLVVEKELRYFLGKNYKNLFYSNAQDLNNSNINIERRFN